MTGNRFKSADLTAMRCIQRVFAFTLLSILLNSTARADWREDIGVFKIGIIAGDDISATLDRVEPFRLAIAKALEIEVQIFPTRDFSTLIDAQINGSLEYAVYSASAYASAYNLCGCIEPLVLAIASDQTREYRATIISRPDGPKNPGKIDLNRFGMVDPQKLGGTSFALHTLKLGGSDFTNQKNIKISTTSDELIDGVLSGKLTAILGWSSFSGDVSTGYSRGTLRRIAEKSGGKSTGFISIWKSLPIPHGPHAVLKKLPSEVKKKLQKTLFALSSTSPKAYDAIEPIFSGGFVTVKHSTYLPMIKFIEAVGKPAIDDQ